MQPNKNTKKIEQIEKISKNNEEVGHNLSEVINKFKVNSIFKETDLVKRSGVLVSTISTALIILPFLGVASVHALFKLGLNNKEAGKKDAFYDVKNNPRINWRNLLFLFAKQFNYIVNQDATEQSSINDAVSNIKATVFDDSALEKTGKYIEGVGYIHDHVKDLHILGFKLLICGFWDGTSFIPIDFSLHREKRDGDLKKSARRLEKSRNKTKKIKHNIKELKQQQKIKLASEKKAKRIYKSKPNKATAKNLEQKQKVVTRINQRIEKIETELNQSIEKEQFHENAYFELKTTYRHCGLTKNETRKQFKKQRDKNTAGYRRKAELNTNKIDASIKMLKRSIKKGFVPDYVLTDTWFFSYKLLETVVSISKGIKLLSMARIGIAKFKILPSGKLLSPREIIIRYERKHSKTNKKNKAKYIAFQAEYQGIRVKIFLIKFGTHGTWRMLVTSDLEISFTKLIEAYKIRWTIEVFFKESKQYLLLGKSQSQDFDAQIADITLSLIRYVLLSYYERIHYGFTIGGLFKELMQSSIKENLLADINIYFVELLQIFSDLAGIDFLTFYQELLRNPKAEKAMSIINLVPKSIISNVA